MKYNTRTATDNCKYNYTPNKIALTAISPAICEMKNKLCLAFIP